MLACLNRHDGQSGCRVVCDYFKCLPTVCNKFMDLAEEMRVEWWDSICFSKCPDADDELSTHALRFLG